MGDFVHVRGPGEFNEEGFRALDKVIEIAHRKGIRVIIPLVDQHKWWGGIGEYAAFRGKPADAFWTDRQIIDDFKATVRYLITRKNTYTGVAYRDEPAIFGWETGNEIDSTPEWTREIAAYIKQLDPNHLVIDGHSLHGVPLDVARRSECRRDHDAPLSLGRGSRFYQADSRGPRAHEGQEAVLRRRVRLRRNAAHRGRDPGRDRRRHFRRTAVEPANAPPRRRLLLAHGSRHRPEYLQGVPLARVSPPATATTSAT